MVPVGRDVAAPVTAFGPEWAAMVMFGCGSAGGQLVAPHLEKVVGGCDESPFLAGGDDAAATEPVDASGGFGVPEHRLDDGGPLPVDVRAGLGGQASFHDLGRCGPGRYGATHVQLGSLGVAGGRDER